MKQPDLPSKITEQMAEHSSCYIFFWYDAEGLPCVSFNFPQLKDKMAILQLLERYLELEHMPPEPEEGDDYGQSDD